MGNDAETNRENESLAARSTAASLRADSLDFMSPADLTRGSVVPEGSGIPGPSSGSDAARKGADPGPAPARSPRTEDNSLPAPSANSSSVVHAQPTGTAA